jgi:hypothetical protein
MNLRHAAALALVGWYLMMPPLAGPNASNLRVDLTAKLSQWEIVDSFDSADVCRVALLKDGHWAEEQAKNGKFESENQRVALRWQRLEEKCVASDDPRLEENRTR